MMEVRLKCQTDLLYLGRCLGYADFQPGGDVDTDKGVHRELANFMVQKNPDVPFRDFCKQDTTSHERLVMLSRGGLKSTICTVIDSVQWIICYPDIAILLITGTDLLGGQLTSEVKAHFEREDDGTPRRFGGEASIFQLAFPEFCTDGEIAKSTYLCPARTGLNIKEPTFSFGTVESNLSGPHYDIVKGDDCVTNANTKTPERLTGIKNQMSLHHKMRQPWGYFDNIGTWYDLSDYYGAMVTAEDKNKTLVWNRGSADTHAAGDREVITHIMIRPCMSRKDGSEPLVDGVLHEEDWDLWWGKRLNWKYLMGERVNLQTFATQYMQNPALGRNVKFTRERLNKAIKPFVEMPSLSNGQGIIVQNWDTAYKVGNWWNNYSVGSCALILGGSFYFLDIVRGQWNETDLPRVMAEFAAKWRPRRVAIEDANGVRFLIRSVMQEFDSRGIKNLFFEFRPVDNSKGSKENNVKPFSKALLENRVVFSNGIPSMDYVIEEFEKFPNGDFDDVVDSVATLVAFYGEIPEALVKMNTTELKEHQRLQQDRLHYERVFGTGRFAASPATSENLSVEQVPGFVSYDPLNEFK